MATTELITRALMAVAIAGVGMGVYGLANRVVLTRASQKERGLENFRTGTPGILYFTTPTCMPCKTVQRPAIQQVQKTLMDDIQIIEVDATEHPDLADYWGILSVPTTFIIDKTGQPRQINHGVTRAEKLFDQIANLQ